MLAKGLRFARVSFLLKVKGSEKIKFENYAHPIYLRPKTSDVPTFHQIFTFKDYDIHFGFKPKTILDAGANVGFASVFFAHKYPDAQIVCVEPEKSNFDVLSKNIQPYKQVVPLRKAIANTSGQTLHVVDNGAGNWMFTTLSKDDAMGKNIIDTIETISIADIMRTQNWDRIDLLKLDIEGAEKELFEKDYDVWLPKTKCLIIELHDGLKMGSSKNFFAAISKYDFNYRQRGENLVFINNDKSL